MSIRNRPADAPRRGRRLRVSLLAISALVVGLLAPLGATTSATAADGSPLPSGRTAYRTIDDFNGEMAALAAGHPDLVKSITLPYKTNGGRDVNGIEITHNVNSTSDGKPVMFMHAAIHGNENPSAEHAMEFALDLVQRDGVEARTTSLLDKVRVIIVPVLNVDGFIMHKRTNCPPLPTECTTRNGIDTNRNFPFGWGGTDTSASVAAAGPGTQPIAKNVMSVITSHQVATYLTNHTSGHTLLRPGLEKRAGFTPDDVLYKSLNEELAAVNNYVPMRSADDYETTGESIDWAYYATRGFAFTYEITQGGSATDYQNVIDDYLGIGRYEGHPNRDSFYKALEQTARTGIHAQIKGDAPKGAVLKITKDFDLWTAPDVLGAPARVPTHLESSLFTPEGSFTWNVNPSVRPRPAYTENGVVMTGPGEFLQESWTLTCSTPEGKVLQTEQVLVDIGQSKTVDLSQCADAFPAYDDLATLIGDSRDGGSFGASTEAGLLDRLNRAAAFAAVGREEYGIGVLQQLIARAKNQIRHDDDARDAIVAAAQSLIAVQQAIEDEENRTAA
jgi:hypothetical protein